MKNTISLIALFAAIVTTSYATTYHEWEDQNVLQRHRLPARASFVPYTQTPGDCSLSLDGEWQFRWTPTPDTRIADFYRNDYTPDASWGSLAVPATWEVNGYGTPIYVSAGYPFVIRPPYVTDEPNPKNTTYVERNPTGQYLRTVTLPETWRTDGGRTMIRFEGVASAFYVWVDGTLAGYSQGAMEPAEFDITDQLDHKTSNHRIALEVYKYSDGAYLEDQDFWRLAGVHRSVNLIHTPVLRIEDLTVRTCQTDGGWLLQVDPELTTLPPLTAEGYTLTALLTDAEGQEVCRLSADPVELLDLEHKAARMNEWFPQRGPRKMGRMEATVTDVQGWTAETPVLYTLTLALADGEGKVVQRLQQRVGFREVRIVHGQMLVNGRPIRLRGVNRVEHDPYLGRVMTEERMLQDILLMKQAGVNAVRTSHYPNTPRWYELCDSLGLYVMDEAGIETHGLRGTLASTPSWHAAFMDRAVRVAERDKNHPSVIIWSMGNESGYGPNFAAISAWLHDFDPTRPVHSEAAQGYIMPTTQDQVGHDPDPTPDPATVDVIARFYPRVQREYLNPKGATGGDQERAENARWERLLSIAQRQLTFRGGLLDGMVDDRPVMAAEYAHAMGNAMGNFDLYWDEIYSHPRMLGGFVWDWVDQGIIRDGHVLYGGDFGDKPNSKAFCLNGVMMADRTKNPKYEVLKQVYAPVRIDHGIIVNLNHHTTLDGYELRWQLVRNGLPMPKWKGLIDLPKGVQPGDTALWQMPSLPKISGDDEVWLNLSVCLRQATAWAPVGYEIYHTQFPLTDNPFASQRDVKPRVTRQLTADSLLSLLRGAARLQVWRAPTDNDKSFGNWVAKDWQRHELMSPKREQVDADTERYTYANGSILVTSHWTPQSDGSVELEQTYAFEGDLPDLARLGIQMALPQQWEQLSWHGLGPDEAYPDRMVSGLIGRWHGTVTDQYTHYPRPQDGGNHLATDLSLTDTKGHGLRVMGTDSSFWFQALHYTPEELAAKAHDHELQPCPEVILNLDCAVLGIGNSSCGPGVLKCYSIDTTQRYYLRLRFCWQ